jgi:threonine dehydratase
MQHGNHRIIGRLMGCYDQFLLSTGEQKMRTEQITLADIYAARQRIAGRVRCTPLVDSPTLSEQAGVAIKLKLEQRQTTGSFKLRGATNALLKLMESATVPGVTAASTGNHGRGLAYAARLAGVPCIICMSHQVPANKVDAVRALGADVRIVGQSQDDAQAEVERLVTDEGLTAISPFDHPDIIAGQGTMGLELMEDFSELASVLVPLSGGGLISGVALAVKTANPAAKVIGISMASGAGMYASQQAGRSVEVPELPTLADALAGGIGADNRWTFRMVRDLVDEIILLEEPEIAAAIRHAYWQEQEVVEGGGAVGIGALLAAKFVPQGPTAIVLSGRNIDMRLHQQIIAGQDRRDPNH